MERPISLNEQRLGAVLAALQASGASAGARPRLRRGQAAAALLDERQFEEIVGMDVSIRALEIAARPAQARPAAAKQRERIELIHGSLIYRDARLAGFDAAAVVEVIEHLDPPRLARLRARPVRVRAARDGRRDDAERRVQRDVARRCPRASSATATTASSGRAPSSRRWAERRRRRASATPSRFLPVGDRGRRGRRADADGGVHSGA